MSTDRTRLTPTRRPDADTAARVTAALETLRWPRRRRLVRLLATQDGPTTLGHAADALAADEYGLDYTRAQRKRVYTALYQTHAPALAEAGLIEFDRGVAHDDPGVLHPTPALDALAELLAVVADHAARIDLEAIE